MTALQTMSPIQGKVGISAELMRSLVLSAGHQIELVRLTTDVCTIRGQRAGTDTWQEVTWSLDDARRADLRGEGWRKYPRAMLMARATTELCRFMFADVLHGTVAVEEYADTPVTTESADAIPTKPTPPAATTPPKVVQRGQQKAADSTPGGSPPPSKSTPALAEGQGPDTRHSAPGESVSTSQSASAGGRPASGKPEKSEEASDGPSLFSDDEPPEPQFPPEERLVGKIARREYHAMMRSLGVEDRDERMFITRTIVGREDLQSSSDMTMNEADTVLAVLRRCKTRRQLEEVVASAHDATT